MRNNPNLDLVNIDAYAKFCQSPSIRSQDIERKRSQNHGMTNDGQPENSLPRGIMTKHCVILKIEISCIAWIRFA